MRNRTSWLAAAAVTAALAVPGSLTTDGEPPGRSATSPQPGSQTVLPSALRTSPVVPAPRMRGSSVGFGLEADAERIRDLADRARRAQAAPPTHPVGVPDPRSVRSPWRRPYEISSANALKLLESGGLLTRDGTEIDVAGATYSRYRMTKRGLPVFNVAGVLRERDGAVLDRSGRLQFPLLSLRSPAVDRDAAIAAAMEAASIEVTRGFPIIEKGWFALPGETVPAWKVVVPAQKPFGSWQVVVDARTGRALSVVDLVLRVTGTGSVYDPNVALSPTPSDVPLFRLDGSGRLQGDIVRVFDARTSAAFSPSNEFRFPEGDARFAQTAVYRAVTDTGIFAEDSGFPPFAESLLAYTNVPDPLTGGEFNNAFYDPFYRLLAFGNGDGAITANLGTDFDVASHETGHHFFEVLVQPSIFSALDPIVAMDEGVADTVAALVSGDPNIGESTLPGQPYLRTLLNSASFPALLGGEAHETGLVYGGANWEILQVLGGLPNAEEFLALLFAALAQLPPDAYEFEYRDAMLQANLDVRGGANQSQIASVFTGRGFESTEFPPEFQGFVEDGVPESRFLSDSPNVPDPAAWNFHLFFFAEYPGATNVTITTTGTGDVDLLVFPLDNENAPVATAENFGSNEQIVLNASSSPSVNDGDFWAIAVFDYPDFSSSSYTLTVTQTLPPSDVFVDGPPVGGYIAAAGGYELLTFQTTVPNQVVRLEVEALDDTLDPLAGIVDPVTFEVFGVDDDSGPGLDVEIQGALIPNPGTYSIIVLSVVADVDPTIGTGNFEVRLTSCDNSAGPNTDGDQLVDVCDDDDDDDTFIDSVDSAPLDPSLCSDLDLDDCDDCSSGAFDPFDDGLDSDNDALCDVGDPDDDNDGCEDGVDAAPLAPSADGDFDFLGNDCDNCPTVANGAQDDADLDDVGDSCDNCQLHANPRDTGGGATAGFTGNQLDSDGDGFGNACDGDFDQTLPIVGFPDLAQLRQALGKDRDSNDCLNDDGSPGGSCAEFDLDGNLPVIGFPDLARFRQLIGSAPGPRCPTCPLPNEP